jgi:SAM-dependent methyltransferase
VHDIVHETHPGAPVVYVDHDPVAVAHSRAILAGNPYATVVQADLRDTDHLLARPELRQTLDFDRPVAVLMVAVLHFIPEEDDPAAVIARIHDAVAPGSHLALTHASHDGDQQNSSAVEALYARSPNPMTMRSRTQVLELFKGFDLVEPGLVFLPRWHPDTVTGPDDDHAERFSGYAGVGLKT